MRSSWLRLSSSDVGYQRYMNIFIATWVLLAVGLVSALPMIVMRVKNDTRNAPESPTCAVSLYFSDGNLALSN